MGATVAFVADIVGYSFLLLYVPACILGRFQTTRALILRIIEWLRTVGRRNDNDVALALASLIEMALLISDYTWKFFAIVVLMVVIWIGGCRITDWCGW